MSSKLKNNELIILNKSVRFNYEILDNYESGIILKGPEVKSIRAKTVNLKDAYAQFKNKELWLINTHISPYRFSRNCNHEATQSRKLLLNRKELDKIYRTLKEKGLTLIPIKLYSKNGKIKLQLGLCRGKKLYDKRISLKERDQKKQMAWINRHY